MNKVFTLLYIIIAASVMFASIPVFDTPLIITDHSGGLQTLRFGLDTTATEGIDTGLGEAPLPPLPPSGVFDARFNLPNGTEASIKDYRQGYKNFIGQKIYNIQFQPGTGNTITLNWNLPSGVKGRLQDVVSGSMIDIQMTGSGNYTVTNPGVYNNLKMTVLYDLSITGLNEMGSDNPKTFMLGQNYPNPFNPTSTINYSIEKDGDVKLTIYNAIGIGVSTIVNEYKQAGSYSVKFNAADLPSGIYFYRLEAGQFSQVKKMMLVK